MLSLTKNIIRIPKRYFFTYVDDKVSHIKLNNINLLNDEQLNSKALLTVQMLINQNTKSLNLPIKTSIENINFIKKNNCTKNLEFICNDGVKINTKLDEFNDFENNYEFKTQVDILDLNTNNLIGQSEIKVNLIK